MRMCMPRCPNYCTSLFPWGKKSTSALPLNCINAEKHHYIHRCCFFHCIPLSFQCLQPGDPASSSTSCHRMTMHSKHLSKKKFSASIAHSGGYQCTTSLLFTPIEKAIPIVGFGRRIFFFYWGSNVINKRSVPKTMVWVHKDARESVGKQDKFIWHTVFRERK